MLAPAADRRLTLIGLLVERCYHALALVDNQAGLRREQFVQVVQHARIILIITHPFEQGRALRNRLAILHQRLAVARLHLAEGAIKKTSPFVWWAIDKVQVSRRK